MKLKYGKFIKQILKLANNDTNLKADLENNKCSYNDFCNILKKSNKQLVIIDPNWKMYYIINEKGSLSQGTETNKLSPIKSYFDLLEFWSKELSKYRGHEWRIEPSIRIPYKVLPSQPSPIGNGYTHGTPSGKKGKKGATYNK